MKKILALTVIIAAISCNEAPKTEEHDHSGGESVNAAAEPKSPVDSLFDAVVALHDEAMPKMGKLKGYEDLTKLRIDSLGKLKDTGSKSIKVEYEKLLVALQRAQKGMNDWMDGFQPDKYKDTDSLLNYYGAEKLKAQAMRDDIFAVMDSATAKFGKP